MSARVVMLLVLVAGPLAAWSRALSGARLGEGSASALAAGVAAAAVAVVLLASGAPDPGPRRPARRAVPRRPVRRPALRFAGVA